MLNANVPRTKTVKEAKSSENFLCYPEQGTINHNNIVKIYFFLAGGGKKVSALKLAAPLRRLMVFHRLFRFL